MTHRPPGELDIVLAPAHAEDLSRIVALLTGSQLPTTDVAAHLDGFVLALAEGQLVGTIALERYGDVALLRSVCVAPSLRSHRVGGALLKAIESDAASHGVHDLYLLTTAAADYFARHGFVRITRDQAPPAIQHTAEFRALCPSSAICMHKALARDTA
jgi:amino-acid N-acetyltransferase